MSLSTESQFIQCVSSFSLSTHYRFLSSPFFCHPLSSCPKRVQKNKPNWFRALSWCRLADFQYRLLPYSLGGLCRKDIKFRLSTSSMKANSNMINHKTCRLSSVFTFSFKKNILRLTVPHVSLVSWVWLSQPYSKSFTFVMPKNAFIPRNTGS